MTDIPADIFMIPDGYIPFLLTFKDSDIHPFEKISMRGKAVRIFAPNESKAIEVVRFRFGKAFNQLHDERKAKGIRYPNGIHEQMIWRQV